MRIPSDLTADPSPRRRHRGRWWLIGFVVVLVILLVSLRSLAGLYTDSLWFSSVDYHNVFSTLLVIKLGLFGVFGAIFFAVLWVNLVVCDRIAGHDIVLAQEDELVRRYQQYVRPYAGRIYVALAFVLALIGASGTIGQWNNWILFRHGGNFGVTDPQFHKDIGFYVFNLPFLTFVVDWTLAILIVTLAVSVVFHYFNGGIQPQRGLPRVRPPVKAHISVLLALIALDKAAGYVLQRWSLVNAQDGYVNGAGYTDVHARLPAETLLIYVSIFAAAILLFNIRRQGWTLPVLAIGIWAFVALVVGHHLPGAAPDAEGDAGAELARGALHPSQHQGHAGRLRREPREGAHFPGSDDHHRQPDGAGHPDHRQHPPVGPGPVHLAADVPAPAGHPAPTTSSPRSGSTATRRAGSSPRCWSACATSRRGMCRPRRGSTPTCSTPTATGRRWPWPTRPTPRTLCSPCRTSPRILVRAARHHPALRLLRARRDRLRRGEHQAARGRLPEERHQRGEPLRGHRRCPALVDPDAGGLRAAPGRLQPADLEPDHRQVADHVRPGPRRHGAEGGAVPHLRPRSVRGDQQRAHRLGRRRLHHDGQLRLLAERQHPAGGHRQHPARAATTTCATRSR